MRILVTGGAGYIGSCVANLLLDEGYEVHIVDNFSTGSRSLLPPKAKIYELDIGFELKITKLLKKIAPKVVIHFAGSVEVEESMINPLKYYDNNIAKSIIFMKSCINANVENFIFSSTAAVYGFSDKKIPIKEDAYKEPQSPYGSSKLILEDLIKEVSSKFKFKSLVFRYFNVAGADKKLRTGQIKDPATHLIKIACEVACGKRENISIFGNDYSTFDGTCIRDYIHVSDLAELHLLGTEYLCNGGKSKILNCGYGVGFSVLEVINKVKEISKNNFEVLIKPRRKGDPEFLVANSELCKKILDWVPKHNKLDEIIKDSLEWEKKLKF